MVRRREAVTAPMAFDAPAGLDAVELGWK